MKQSHRQKPDVAPVLRKFEHGDPTLLTVQELYDGVARHAYELFAANGRVDGHDLDDWFRSERDLLEPVPCKVLEWADRLTVHAEIPKSALRTIQILVGPRQLVIYGEHEGGEEQRGDEKDFARVVDLPFEIDAEHVSATLRDGELEISLLKTAATGGSLGASQAA